MESLADPEVTRYCAGVSGLKVALVLGGPVIVGLALGLGLGSLTATEPAELPTQAARPQPDPSRVVVEQVQGEVWARADGLQWRPIAEGDAIRRPVSFRTVGIDGYVRISVKNTRIAVAQDSIVHFGGAGMGLPFQVDQGVVLAYREKQAVRAIVPAQELDVIGSAFGIWVRPDRVEVAVLGDKVEIRHRDDPAASFAVGREVSIRNGQVEASMMAPKLTIELITKRRVGGKSRIAARTWLNAQVFAFGEDGYEEVELTRGGTFAIQVPGEFPDPGTLIAIDSAGRIAEIDRGSKSLEQVLDDLKAGRSRRARPKLKMAVKTEDESSSRRRRRRRRRSSSGVDSGDRLDGDGDRSRSRSGSRKRSRRRSSGAQPPPLQETDDEDAEGAL